MNPTFQQVSCTDSPLARLFSSSAASREGEHTQPPPATSKGGLILRDLKDEAIDTCLQRLCELVSESGPRIAPLARDASTSYVHSKQPLNGSLGGCVPQICGKGNLQMCA